MLYVQYMFSHILTSKMLMVLLMMRTHLGDQLGHGSSLSNFLTVLSMPTTKLYEPPLAAQQGPAGAARSSMDPALGRLVGPSMGFSPVFCSKSELDTQADTAQPRWRWRRRPESIFSTRHCFPLLHTGTLRFSSTAASAASMASTTNTFLL